MLIKDEKRIDGKLNTILRTYRYKIKDQIIMQP